MLAYLLADLVVRACSVSWVSLIYHALRFLTPHLPEGSELPVLALLVYSGQASNATKTQRIFYYRAKCVLKGQEKKSPARRGELG